MEIQIFKICHIFGKPDNGYTIFTCIKLKITCIKLV